MNVIQFWCSEVGAALGVKSSLEIASATVLSTAGSIFVGAVSGAIAGAAGGFVATGSLRGAVTGAVSGAVFGGIGAGLSDASNFTQVSAHSLAGGVLSELQGGKFGHGFLSAGFTKWAGKTWTLSSSSDVISNSLKQAIIGGTASKLTGGKFANGAFTAALQYIVNEASETVRQAQQESGKGFWSTIRDKFASV